MSTKRTIKVQLSFETDVTDAQLEELLKETSWKLTRNCKGRMVVSAVEVTGDDAQLLWDSAGLGPEPSPDAELWKPGS